MDNNELHQSKIKVTDYRIIENLEVEFTNWFTILSGENGTGKSSILRNIKNEKGDDAVLYNPKRNSIKKELVQAVTDVRGGARKKQNLLEELNKNFDDNLSHPYSSFSETVAAEYEDRRHSQPGSVPPDEIIKGLEDDFGKLVTQIFPKYKAIEWKFSGDGPYFKIEKFGKHALEVNQLSTGEQEILSLVFSVLSVIDSKALILIDEPEIHLNWGLEEKLFTFLKELTNKKKIQIIVATHSRIVAEAKFNQNVIFLYFDRHGKIVTNTSIPKEIRKKIIGKVLNVIVSEGSEKIITVEDEFHEKVILLLASKLANSQNISVYKLSHRQGVESLYRSVINSASPTILDNGHFMVDGDGKDEVFADDSRFICLNKGYNLETYFVMKLKLIHEMTNISESKIKKHISDIINERKIEKAKGIGGWNYLGTITPQQVNTKLLSKIDGKIILPGFSKKLGYDSQEEYVKDFIDYIASDGRKLRSVFDKKLIAFFKQPSN